MGSVKLVHKTCIDFSSSNREIVKCKIPYVLPKIVAIKEVIEGEDNTDDG